MRALFISFLFALTPWTAAVGQVPTVNIRLQDGDSLVGRSWYFTYSCDLGFRDNPNLAVRHTWRSDDLRLVVDGKDRLVPVTALASIRFDWETPRPGRLTRSRARFLLTSGETIVQWDLRDGRCEGNTVTLDFVLPPEGTRQDWVRIDLWTTVDGEASSFTPKERVVEVHFISAATH